mgnify:CR=1 FL=1
MIDIIYVNSKVLLAMVWTSWISFIAWLIGGFDLLIWTILTLMTLDYISGILVGYKEKTLNSKRGFKGLCKKVMILIIICCSSLISQILKNTALRDMVIIFYCSIEILSILENAGKIGVPIPKKLKKALEQCKEESEIKSNKK